MFSRSSFKLAFCRVVAAQLIVWVAGCGGDGSGGSYTAPPGAPTAAGLTTEGGPAAASPSMQGAAGGTPAPGSTATPPASNPPALKEQIAALERSGAYPALDRSADIAGPDVNKNGVRDDIEAWINAQPVTDTQRKTLLQKARALQRTLIVDLKDSSALQEVGNGLSASWKCGGDNFPNLSEFSRLSGKIEAMTANTKERAARYMQYNAARSGSTTTRPSGDACEP